MTNIRLVQPATQVYRPPFIRYIRRLIITQWTMMNCIELYLIDRISNS